MATIGFIGLGIMGAPSKRWQTSRSVKVNV
jgi:3-hydroxyisobutyrate dehydrogenase-like beta-hydroxyacid dehydrogenase